MSLLKTLFGSRKSVSSLLTDAQYQIFKLYGVSEPTDSQKLRALFYLGVAGQAMALGSGRERWNVVMEKVIDATKELTKPLSMRVGTLVDGKEELNGLIKEFREHVNVNSQTLVSGYEAFGALIGSKTDIVMNKIVERKRDPLGMAVIVVGDGIFGPGRSRDHFVELSIVVLEFIKELHKST